jgi:hypothetical protein
VSDVQSAPAPSAGRPTVVTPAGYLMIAVGVLGVVLAVLPLPYASDASTAAKHAYANAQNGDQLSSAVTVGIYISLAVDLVGSAGLLLLGFFNLRGSNITRIMTWVLAGLGVLCCGGGTLIGRLAGGMTTANTNGVDTKQAQKEIAAAYPSWYEGVQITLTVIAVLGLIAVIILLALPSAHPFFRRRQVVLDEPALPYPPYPVAATPPAEAAAPPTTAPPAAAPEPGDGTPPEQREQ